MKRLSLMIVLILGLMLVLAACKDNKQEDAEIAPAADSTAEAGQVDQTDPEAVVKAYFAAWEAGDGEGVLAYTMDGLQVKAEDKAELIEEYKDKMATPQVSDLKIVSSKIEGDEATFEVLLTANGKEGPATAKLNLVEGKWYIDD